MKIVKFLVGLTVIGVSVILLTSTVPAEAQGQTTTALQTQINEIARQIAQLQIQLQAMQTGGQTNISGIPAGFSFDKNLSLGSRGDDVRYLQIVLNSDPATQLTASGAGSKGNETTFFGPLTKTAVIKFQEKYAAEILAPFSLNKGTGFVGAATRAKLNKIIQPQPTQPTPTQPTQPTPTPTPAQPAQPTPTQPTQPEPPDNSTPPQPSPGITGNILNVSAASDSPPDSNIAAGANANFLKLILSAGDSDVKLKQIVITRSGLSSNLDVKNITITDEQGVKITPSANLGSDSKIQLGFNSPVIIPAKTTKTVFVRAGISPDVATVRTIILSIQSPEDVITEKAQVTGKFPIKSGVFSVYNVKIGGVQVVNDGTVVDARPDVGDTDVVLNQFKVIVDATESVTIEQIRALKDGSSIKSSTQNIKLIDLSRNQVIGATEWNNEGKAVWSNLNLVIQKGGTKRFRITADISSGSGLTVNADITDGDDVLITVKGNSYGFYLTPTVVEPWNGKGANDQSIQAGSLSVQKSLLTPPVGKITQSSKQNLAAFDFVATGEPIRIKSLKLSFDLENITTSQVNNITLYDKQGSLVAGPKNITAEVYAPNTTSYEGTVVFNEIITLPVGVTSYFVYADISASAPNGSAVYVGIAKPVNDITATGTKTNRSVSAELNVDEVNANQQTVSAGMLEVTTLIQPASASVAKGAQKFLWATAALSANNSGEDVLITEITVKNTTGNSANTANLVNIELWAGLTNEASARGDAFETKIVKQAKTFPASASEAALTFTLSPALTVSKGSFVKIAVLGDVSTNALADSTYTVKVDNAVSQGISTGNPITPTLSGTGQQMTVKTGGTLTLSVDSASPDSKIVLAGSSKETVAIFRLSANNIESLNLNSIQIASVGSLPNAITNYYFYADARTDGLSISEPIGTAPGRNNVLISFPDNTVTIPAGGKVKITVKVDSANIDDIQIKNGHTVQIAIQSAGDVKTTGKASGQLIQSNQTDITSSAHKLYESYPKFALNTNSPSGPLIPSANTLLAVFNVTAVGEKDITFDNANGNKIVFQITTVGDDTNSADEIITFRDDNGNTLGLANFSSNNATKNAPLDFSIRSFTVPSESTRRLYVYGDTTDLEDSGNIIQVWLEGNSDDIDFGIDGKDFANSEGDKIFRNSIYANALVKP